MSVPIDYSHFIVIRMIYKHFRLVLQAVLLIGHFKWLILLSTYIKHPYQSSSLRIHFYRLPSTADYWLSTK